MNEVYALDPNSRFGFRDLKFIIDQCGFGEGRFLAKIPKWWGQEVLEKFDDIERAKVVTLLQRAAFLDCFCKYDSHYPWLVNALEARGKSDPQIENVITDSAAEGVVELARLLDDPQFRLKDSRGSHIPRRVDSYLKACDPLFRVSGEIFLVDKFFTCWHGEHFRSNRRQIKVLSAFLTQASKYGVCERFVIINSRTACLRGRAEDVWAEQLECIFRESKANNLELEYAFIEDLIGTSTVASGIHARYIFSKQGGLQFDHGFDLDASSSQSNHVHWLSPSEFCPVFEMFGPITRGI